MTRQIIFPQTSNVNGVAEKMTETHLAHQRTQLTWQPALRLWYDRHFCSRQHRLSFKCHGIKSPHYKQKIYYENSLR